MLSVNVCQMVQDAGLYGVMTTGLKCHQARCNQSVGHSSTIWDLSLSALSEPGLNLGHGLRGVSAKPGKRTAAHCFPCRDFETSCSSLQCAARDKPGPRPPRTRVCKLERGPVAPVLLRSGFALTTHVRKGSTGCCAARRPVGRAGAGCSPRAWPRCPVCSILPGCPRAGDPPLRSKAALLGMYELPAPTLHLLMSSEWRYPAGPKAFGTLIKC